MRAILRRSSKNQIVRLSVDEGERLSLALQSLLCLDAASPMVGSRVTRVARQKQCALVRVKPFVP